MYWILLRKLVLSYTQQLMVFKNLRKAARATSHPAVAGLQPRNNSHLNCRHVLPLPLATSRHKVILIQLSWMAVPSWHKVILISSVVNDQRPLVIFFLCHFIRGKINNIVKITSKWKMIKMKKESNFKDFQHLRGCQHPLYLGLSR